MTLKCILLIFSYAWNIFFAKAQAHYHMKGANYEGVVFDSKHSYPFLTKKERFIPSAIEISNLEKKLTKDIINLISDYRGHVYTKCRIEKKLLEYKRQYFGYIDKGKKIIFTSFINSTPAGWKKNVVFVEGGGCNYFQLKYGVNSEKFYDLNINSSE